jgi:hypothetical protein
MVRRLNRRRSRQLGLCASRGRVRGGFERGAAVGEATERRRGAEATVRERLSSESGDFEKKTQTT